MYIIPEEVQQKDAISLANKNGLSIAPKSDAEVGGADTKVVLERNMK